MVDGGQLIGREVGVRGDRGRHDGQAAELDRLAVHDGVGQLRGGPRPAVDPRRPAVGQHDVGRTVRRGDARPVETGGLHRPPPDGLALAGVVGVGPGQEVQAVERRLRTGRQAPRLDVDRAWFAERRRVEAEGDDDRLAGRPRGVQPGHGRGGVGQHGVVDRDDRRVPPRRRHGSAGDDDDAAPELARTGNRHASVPSVDPGRRNGVHSVKLGRGCHGSTAVTMPTVPSRTT